VAHAFVQLHCKKFHDCVGTLKEALALYRRALPSNHATILITITNVDSASGHIVSHHVDAGDYRGALNAASDALQFLKHNLPSNDVMVSPLILATLLFANKLRPGARSEETS
jgi:hypothetical protein